MPEPDIAPKSILATTFVCAREPGILPVNIFAKLISFMAIPPLFIILPARIKNGIAIRLNTEIPENILCAPVISAGSVDNTGRIAHIEETAREIAIGAPAISIIIRITNIIRPDNHAMLMLLLLSL